MIRRRDPNHFDGSDEELRAAIKEAKGKYGMLRERIARHNVRYRTSKDPEARSMWSFNMNRCRAWKNRLKSLERQLERRLSGLDRVAPEDKHYFKGSLAELEEAVSEARDLYGYYRESSGWLNAEMKANAKIGKKDPELGKLWSLNINGCKQWKERLCSLERQLKERLSVLLNDSKQPEPRTKLTRRRLYS